MRLTEAEYQALISKKQVQSVTVAKFTVPDAVAKPRMTRRDRWAKRPAVERYFAFCDLVRASAPQLPEDPGELIIRVEIGMPASWSKKKKKENLGQPHRCRPDTDNLTKAIKDALFTEDSMIWKEQTEKRWGTANRTHITVIQSSSIASSLHSQYES